MDTLAEVLARGREREGTVLEAPGRSAPHSYREFAANAWKAGNLLRHYGVRPGTRVALVVGPKRPAGDEVGRLGTAADPLLALFGAAAAGAAVDVTPETRVEARALVAPAAWLDRYEAVPGCSTLAYGGPPDRPEIAHFERERWSENATEPPGSVAPADPVLRAGDSEYTHAALLAAARGVVDDHALEPGDIVAVDAPLTSAGTVAAGVVAPLLAGATIRPVRDGAGSSGSGAVYTVGTDGGSGTLDPSSVVA